MTTIKFGRAVSIVSLAAIATLTNGLSARAQTAETTIAEEGVTLSVEPVEGIETLSMTAPIPGTALTTADALAAQPQTPQTHEINPQSSVDTIAQAPSSRTRGGSYIGGGFDIGLAGDTALGDSGFVILSKLGFTQNLSLRGLGIIGDGTVLIFNVTYDFPILQEEFEPLQLSPFVGGGVAFDLEDDRVGPVISGGVDYPINDNFTATASLNIGFIREDETDIGILFGVGYNFSGLIQR